VTIVGVEWARPSQKNVTTSGCFTGRVFLRYCVVYDYECRASETRFFRRGLERMRPLWM